MTADKTTHWLCPIFGKDIAEGKCLDINYERLGLLQDGCLDEIRKVTGMKEDEVNRTCEACPNLPVTNADIAAALKQGPAG